MEALGGLEPPTNGLGNRCSIHLSYRARATQPHYLTLVYRGRDVPAIPNCGLLGRFVYGFLIRHSSFRRCALLRSRAATASLAIRVRVPQTSAACLGQGYSGQQKLRDTTRKDNVPRRAKDARLGHPLISDPGSSGPAAEGAG
jgi:hypothetical protein